MQMLQSLKNIQIELWNNGGRMLMVMPGR